MKSLFQATFQRLSGDKPSAMRAILGATAASTATGVLVYRLLRSAESD